MRFSNAGGEKGSFDTGRNVRGFAVKFVKRFFFI
jgi:catalase